jgi:hypothetical protein
MPLVRYWSLTLLPICLSRHLQDKPEHGSYQDCSYKIWGFHGSDYEECHPLRYKTPVRTSLETRYVSTTQPSLLMPYKIWGLHGSDYEEWPLGHKTPVFTSQETHYVSATEPSQLMLLRSEFFTAVTMKNVRNVPPKRRSQQEPLGVTSQKTSFLFRLLP